MRIATLGNLSAAAIALLASAAAIVPVTAIRAQEKAPASSTNQAQKSEEKVKKVLTEEEKAAADLAKRVSRAKAQEGLFAGLTPLPVTLTTNIKKIRGDKADKAPWRGATLKYTDAAGKEVVIPTQIRTRGIWRLKNCEFPPLRLNFKGEVTKGTLLQGLDKPKLVNYCRDTDDYEQYILEEMQLYRIYNLLTPASHRARLMNVTYTDSASGKVQATRHALLVEEPEVMAARLGGPIMDLKGALPDDLDPFHDALLGVFQYFIGNTDYSIYALHNVELVNQATGEIVPVPYDFDFSGVISANYATTDPKLSISRVRDRLFKGYCQPMADYDKVFARFNEKKDAIYALYTDSVGMLIKPKIVEETLKYYDEFYKTINDAKRAKREIGDPCVKTH
jgi:hypothetical protein